MAESRDDTQAMGEIKVVDDLCKLPGFEKVEVTFPSESSTWAARRELEINSVVDVKA